MIKYNLMTIKFIPAFIFLSLNLNVFGEEIFKNDFFMGSLVKSDIWEIDRTKKTEIFKGNVFFENKFYLFKAENAIYNHQTKKWNIFGNVYCKKKIDLVKYLEIKCERAIYDQNTQKGFLYSNKVNNIEIKYFETDQNIYKAFSEEAVLNIIDKEIFLNKNFKIIVSSITGNSNQAIYKEITSSFEMLQNPYIDAFDDKYKVYIRGDRIIFNINKKNISVFSNVYGTLYKRENETNSTKFNKKIW
ncbi:MAG: hypothetical protein N2446_00025 [Elusimicrobiales bacterium]|nr:hypothetical protein [Elusimicrobiales bacterium]